MDLLLIGGVSGSGKNVALAALEDSGYHAINNLPPSMLVPTIRDLARSGHERVAIALDVKSGPGLPDIGDAIRELRASGWTVRFLYLDAKTDTLVKRFSETRRRHPFSSDERTLTEAIEHERALLGTPFLLSPIDKSRHIARTMDRATLARGCEEIRTSLSALSSHPSPWRASGGAWVVERCQRQENSHE